jgi:ornithine cyclodeaminase/alanine dehydrogenase-like protein (mu-crystallin family)
MKLVRQQQIIDLGIQPRECVAWVKECFRIKYDCILPHKISLKPFGEVFYNTMPCYIPEPINRFGVKEVSRYPDEKPALNSELLLYDGRNGNLLALMDANWITAMRTGAVAALAIQTFKSSQASVCSFIGLGNTARATLLCLLETSEREWNIRLMAYKGQELDFIRRFEKYKNVSFQIVDSHEDLVKGADIVVSCITAANELIAPDNCYKEGCLVIPVHTRGFQNCDLFFDKVFADDTGHVSNFKYFDRFRQFDEIGRVLKGEAKGRENDRERILSYNIGIGLHDVYFASRIYDMLERESETIDFPKNKNKFWI